MNTPGNPGEKGDLPRTGQLPFEDPGVRRQLEQLFGESLFGPWPQLHQHSVQPPPARNRKRWPSRLVVALVLAAGVLGVRSLVRRGLERQLDDRRGHYAQELKIFIEDGDLERASQFLPMVQRPSKYGRDRSELDPHDPHLDLIVVSEATLFRYYDADPIRLRKIRPFLDDAGRASPSRQIANLIVASREQRAARLADIERLRNDLPNNNELEYLLATALEYRGDIAPCHKAWERSAKLEPAWLGHRFEQARFEFRSNDKAIAQQLATDIVQASPDSGWAWLAVMAFQLPADVQAQLRFRDAGAAAVTPVLTYFELLTRSIDTMQHNRRAQATELLNQAGAAIHYQAPFLLDAFDWCLEARVPALAQELTRIPGWPKETGVTSARQQRLTIALANPAASASGASAPPRSPSN